MNSVIISTKLYPQEVMDFSMMNGEGDILEIFQKGDIHFFSIQLRHFHSHVLTELMEDIILDNNPVVRSSYRLYNMMKKIIFSQERQYIQKDLDSIFFVESMLYLDGYIKFRMQKYERKINDVLYAVVKKNLYGQQYEAVHD